MPTWGEEGSLLLGQSAVRDKETGRGGTEAPCSEDPPDKAMRKDLKRAAGKQEDPSFEHSSMNRGIYAADLYTFNGPNMSAATH